MAGSIRRARARLVRPVEALPRLLAGVLRLAVDRLVDALPFGAARLFVAARFADAVRFAAARFVELRLVADRFVEARFVAVRPAVLDPRARDRPFDFARLFDFALVAMGVSLAFIASVRTAASARRCPLNSLFLRWFLPTPARVLSFAICCGE